MKLKKQLVFALILLLLAALVTGVTPGAERPEIGLVLSGGGARGSAHVGVLKVMEELRIPVDYVVGTSMGSIVGALYALGLSADEIETTLLAVDWGRTMTTSPSPGFQSAASPKLSWTQYSKKWRC